MCDIRRAATSDIAALIPLVAEYWRFETIAGFDADRIGSQLARLLSAR